MIRNIVFDVGRVLIDFSYDSFSAFMQGRGASVRTYDEFLCTTRLLDYEQGLLSSEEFLDLVDSCLSQKAGAAVLIDRWNMLFAPIDEMLALLDSLSPRYRTFLLSNTNELHWRYLNNRFRLEERVQGTVTSFRVRASKPQPEIFQAVEQEFQVQPHETLFIDDVALHVEEAVKRGWRGIHHRSPEATRLALRRFGVEWEPG